MCLDKNYSDAWEFIIAYVKQYILSFFSGRTVLFKTHNGIVSNMGLYVTQKRRRRTQGCARKKVSNSSLAGSENAKCENTCIVNGLDQNLECREF